MTTNYTSSSQYYTTSQTTWYLDYWNYRQIPEDSTDYYMIVEGKYNERPDMLSYDLYGSMKYWWIFSILNKDTLIDPIYDLKQGMTIRVPSQSRLTNLLG